MARLPRLFIPGCPQHVVQRGHNRMTVFADDADRHRYLGWLAEVLPEREVALHAYALLDGQVHLLVSAPTAAATSAAMQSIGRRYARHFNDRHARSGTIWEGRYRSTVVATDAYVMACYRHVDLAAVRAGLAEHPASHAWSSYLHHVGRRSDAFLTDHARYWALGNTPFERQAAYERLCLDRQDPQIDALIDDMTLNGWALGEPAPGRAAASRRLARLKAGRPPRQGP